VLPSGSTDTSQPNTETEDDGDIDMDRDHNVDETLCLLNGALHNLRASSRHRIKSNRSAPRCQRGCTHHLNDAQGGVVGGDGVRIEDGICPRGFAIPGNPPMTCNGANYCRYEFDLRRPL
jgi:hypothetical protein